MFTTFRSTLFILTACAHDASVNLTIITNFTHDPIPSISSKERNEALVLRRYVRGNYVGTRQWVNTSCVESISDNTFIWETATKQIDASEDTTVGGE